MKSIFTLIALVCISLTYAQDRFATVEIETIKVSDHVYMLKGAGGNIGLSVGEEKVIMIDDQFSQLAAKIKKAVSEITDLPITYLINTHHHGDHTGGNADFNSEETTLIAHENVAVRLKDKPEAFHPEETLSTEMELDWNTGQVMLLHVDNAHTDGDTIIYFVTENVIHMGDCYFSGRYPFIDLNSGGSIDGYIQAQQIALHTSNEDTAIIPGHGDLATVDQMFAYMYMLQAVNDRIQKKIDNGATRDTISTDTSITTEWDLMGYGDGFISSQKFRETVYDSLTQ